MKTSVSVTIGGNVKMTATSSHVGSVYVTETDPPYTDVWFHSRHEGAAGLKELEVFFTRMAATVMQAGLEAAYAEKRGAKEDKAASEAEDTDVEDFMARAHASIARGELPDGVTAVSLGDPGELHNTIAEAVGEAPADYLMPPIPAGPGHSSDIPDADPIALANRLATKLKDTDEEDS